MGTLTLGGLTTGNIVIDSGSSSITLSDATTASSSLTVSGTLTANGLFDANGQVDLGDGGDTFSLASTTIDITAGAVSGVTTLSLSGAITDSDSAATDSTITTGVINLDVDAGNAAVIGLDLNIESITGITAATDITGQKITILQNDDDADHLDRK